MNISFPKLPYEMDALEPFISQETIEYHYGKHHKGYFEKLTKLIAGTEFENKNLENIIQTSNGAVFNNAAQVFNHTFYWNGMSPGSSIEPIGEIKKLINKNFDSFLRFQEQFTSFASSLFGSGWCWLIKDGDELIIEKTSNAGCPIKEGKQILLTCDVWEHAYYIDYRNERVKYIESWWNVINWDFVNKNL